MNTTTILASTTKHNNIKNKYSNNIPATKHSPLNVPVQPNTTITVVSIQKAKVKT